MKPILSRETVGTFIAAVPADSFREPLFSVTNEYSLRSLIRSTAPENRAQVPESVFPVPA